jgi:glutamyl-tRNA reductase
MVERALKSRKRKPMFMIDLAVPRNIEPEVSCLEDVYLYCIDDLESMVSENRDKRQKAAMQAEKLIEVEAREFMEWVAAQSSLSTLKSFRNKYETMRTVALNEALLKLKMGNPPEEVLTQFSKALTNRILHEPTVKLREAGFSQDEVVLRMMREIFELNLTFESDIINHETIHTT